MVYLVAEVTGVIFFAAIYYCLDALIRFPFADRIMTSVSIAFANTVFRFIKVVALLPFTRQIEKVVDLLVPDRSKSRSSPRPSGSKNASSSTRHWPSSRAA